MVIKSNDADWKTYRQALRDITKTMVKHLKMLSGGETRMILIKSKTEVKKII